jgi:hypothetical protein
VAPWWRAASGISGLSFASETAKRAKDASILMSSLLK